LDWLIVVLLIVLILFGCHSQPNESELSWEAQGKRYRVHLAMDAPSTPLTEIQDRISTKLQVIQTGLFSYRNDSEISRINRSQSTAWISVSPELAQLLSMASKVYEHSEACFDLTARPIFELWESARRLGNSPTQQEIDAVLSHVGMSLLEVDVGNHRIRKKDPELKLDLSPLAHGYSLGSIADDIEALGIHDYLVEFDGETVVKGRKRSWPHHWQVRIDKPKAFNPKVSKTLEAAEQAGAAIFKAGTYRNKFQEDTGSTLPIINPKTGRPVTHHLRSATVVDKDPTWAEVWGQALLCAGEREAARIADAENLQAVLISENGGVLDEHVSKALMATP